MLIGGVTMCFATSYELSMLAFVVVGPIMYLWDLYGNWSKSLSRRVLAAWAEANAVATEALHHIRTVKAFVTEDTETKKYDEACGEALRLGIRDALGFWINKRADGVLRSWHWCFNTVGGWAHRIAGRRVTHDRRARDVPVVLDDHERGLPGVAGARDVLYT